METFTLNPLPVRNIDCSLLLSLVGQANAAIARYDGLLQGIVNPAILLSPLTTQEAVLSSKIEGTQATLDEVLGHEAGLDSKDMTKTNDIQEVLNYRKALIEASEDLAKGGHFSLSLVRKMHKILMESVRGEDKTPGEFRKGQNWIGRHGCKIEEATYVPPPPDKLPFYLENWVGYMNGGEIDSLIQMAILHAQFELIHPFNDGNGRIGRLVIPLFLSHKKILGSPMFYLSSYLERNRGEYYVRLQGISKEDNWNAWIEFFLKAVLDQALENTGKVRAIRKLYDAMKDRIADITRSQYSMQILDAVFDKPIFRTSDFLAKTEIPKQTAMPLLKLLKENSILAEIRPASGRQAAVLQFPELLKITEGR